MTKLNWNFSTHENYFDDFETAPRESTFVSLRPTDLNWHRLEDLSKLEEVTAIEPSQDQLEYLATLPQLKRLRIAKAKIHDPNLLSQNSSLEELALIWVRNLTDFTSLRKLPHLRSLYLENVNGLTDFSSLAGFGSLSTLEITGKIGKQQTINDLAFISELKGLHVLKLGSCHYRSDFPVFQPLRHLEHLEYLSVVSGCTSIDDWAYLCVHFPNMENASDPLIHVMTADWLEGVHSSQDLEALPNVMYAVMFGTKGFGFPNGLKADILPKIRRFEMRWEKALARVRSHI